MPMTNKSTEWRITVKWPYTPPDDRNLGLEYYLDHPDKLQRGVWGVYPVRVESFEVGLRMARLVVTVTARTIRPEYEGDRTRFRSSAQGALDIAIRAACFAAALTHLIRTPDDGLPEPVRFEVRSITQ
jgi:hypothetical protein